MLLQVGFGPRDSQKVFSIQALTDSSCSLLYGEALDLVEALKNLCTLVFSLFNFIM